MPKGKNGWPWNDAGEPLGDLMTDGEPWPKISIVTPSYNQGEFIEETIRSVLLQGYPSLEYIIIDGGSKDQTVDIIKKYEPWLKYWVSEPDDGQANAINKGFEKATGEIFAYINSDDIYLPSTFEQVAEILGFKGSDLGLVCFAGQEWDGTIELGLHIPRKAPDLFTWLDTETSLFQPSTFWTRKLHEAIGGFNEQMDFCFDKDFFIKAIFLHHCYKFVPEHIASKFRIHPSSKTSTLSKTRECENQIILENYSNHPLLGRDFKKARKKRIASLKISAAFEAGNTGEKVRLLLSAVRVDSAILASRYFWGAVRRTIFG